MGHPHQGKIFYGWYIVAVAFIANFMAIGTTLYVFNAFMEPLCEANNWTRTDVNLALLVGCAVGYCGQLLFGTLVMRFGVRYLMLIGCLISGLSFILLMRTQTLWVFYVYYILISLGAMGYGGIVANTAVNNWFVEKRGTALGIANAGISTSGAVLPFVAMFIILNSNMATASLLIGLVLMAIGPLAWIVARDWPEDHGLQPDGRHNPHPQTTTSRADIPLVTSSDNTPGTHSGDAPWNLRTLLKTGAFWKLGLTFALVLTGVTGVMSQLKPRFTEIGFNDMTAMGMMAATALIGAVAKYVWGVLCDNFDSQRIVACLIAGNALGLSLSLLHGSRCALFSFIIIFGFSMGGVISTFPIIVSDFFGRRAFPAVFRYISMFLILELTGFVIAGQSFDRTGSYDTAYLIFGILDVLAVCLILSVRRPRPHL